jgi:2-methylcitrate dehydratase PrpD
MTGPVEAALINGLAGHEMDFDDVAIAIHPSADIMPASLAVAQDRDASGERFIEAVVTGQETSGRVERLVGYAHYDAGWHVTGTVGTFSAAAAAAKILGLDLAQIEMALGIAGTQAAGLRAVFGSMCKSFHAGKAASNGTLAALLAEAGFTSAPNILEAEYGFVWAESSRAQAEALNDYYGEQWVASAGPSGAEAALRPLGDPYLADEIIPKMWASCASAHSAIGAVELLREEHGIIMDQIQKVVAYIPPFALDHAGIENPRTGLEGKFSVRYAVTAALLGYDTMGAAFTDEAVNSPEAKEAIKCVQAVYAPSTTRNAPSEVHVTLKNGQRLVKSFDHHDHIAGWEKLSYKFNHIVPPITGPDVASRLEDAVFHLEGLASMRAITDILRDADIAATASPQGDTEDFQERGV